MKNLNENQKFKIVDYKSYDLYTRYTIKYNSKNYVCYFNHTLPKLQGINLNINLRKELNQILKDFFLNTISKKNGVKRITNYKF